MEPRDHLLGSEDDMGVEVLHMLAEFHQHVAVASLLQHVADRRGRDDALHLPGSQRRRQDRPSLAPMPSLEVGQRIAPQQAGLHQPVHIPTHIEEANTGAGRGSPSCLLGQPVQKSLVAQDQLLGAGLVIEAAKAGQEPSRHGAVETEARRRVAPEKLEVTRQELLRQTAIQSGQAGQAISQLPPADRGRAALITRVAFTTALDRILLVGAILALTAAVVCFSTIRSKDFVQATPSQ